MENLYLSVIVPVYNEEGAVLNLFHRILNVCKKLEKPFEIIFINDGSDDRTLEILKTLKPLKIISFRKNFGQTAAMDAGFKASRGKYIAPLDGDGQNDPDDIIRLINKLEEDNLDVVSGWRKNRKDKLSKKLSSLLAARIRKFLINDGIHDSGCTLKVYRRECFEGLDLIGEMHRFIPAILKINGFKIGELEVNHYPRTTGQTKYNFKRGIKGILDMFTVWFWKKYINRPLHLFGSMGLFLIFISILAGFWSAYLKIFKGVSLSDTILTDLSLMGLLIGIQFFVFGLLADILSKNYHIVKNETIYNIKEIINND